MHLKPRIFHTILPQNLLDRSNSSSSEYIYSLQEASTQPNTIAKVESHSPTVLLLHALNPFLLQNTLQGRSRLSATTVAQLPPQRNVCFGGRFFLLLLFPSLPSWMIHFAAEIDTSVNILAVNKSDKGQCRADSATSSLLHKTIARHSINSAFSKWSGSTGVGGIASSNDTSAHSEA